MSDKYPPREQWGLRHITVAATAGDVDTDLNPGAGFRWVPLYGRLTFIADANAANRVLGFAIEEVGGADLTPVIASNIAIEAGQTRHVGLVTGWGLGINQTSGGSYNAILSFPDYILEGTDVLNFTWSGGLAGDSYSGFITVLELKL